MPPPDKTGSVEKVKLHSPAIAERRGKISVAQAWVAMEKIHRRRQKRRLREELETSDCAGALAKSIKAPVPKCRPERVATPGGAIIL